MPRETRRPTRGLYMISRDLERRCLELQRRALTFKQIGDEVGVSPKRVGTVIRKAFARADEAGENALPMQKATTLARIDECINAIYDRAIGSASRIVIDPDGNDVAVKMVDWEAQRALRDWEKMRADLLGMNAPKKVEADIRSTHAIDEKLEELLTRVKPEIPKSIGAGSTVVGKIIDVGDEEG